MNLTINDVDIIQIIDNRAYITYEGVTFIKNAIKYKYTVILEYGDNKLIGYITDYEAWSTHDMHNQITIDMVVDGMQVNLILDCYENRFQQVTRSNKF
jgi:hypothetical protein